MLTVPITRVGLVRMCILGLLEDSLRVKSVLEISFLSFQIIMLLFTIRLLELSMNVFFYLFQNKESPKYSFHGM